jgi:hypothetical protein
MKRLLYIFVCLNLLVGHTVAAEPVNGYFNEYYLGMKSGGPWGHAELKKQIERMLKDDSLTVLCVIGPDNTAVSAFDVEKYRETHTKVEVSPTCKGGGWVYVGPYADIELAKENRFYYTNAMLHTMEGKTLLCESSVCVVVNE